MTDFQEQTSGFEAWLGTNFLYLSPKFRIADLREKSQGRGLIATEDIEKDEILFKIPRKSILNVDTGALSIDNKDQLVGLNQWQALILIVAYEWFLKEDSKWFNYFNVVPLQREDYSSLMFWSDDEYKWLDPSSVLDRIAKEQSNEMYDMLTLYLEDFKVSKEFKSWFTRERFHIVASLIMSYSFDVDHPEEVERLDNEEDESEKEAYDQNHTHDEDSKDAHKQDDQTTEEKDEGEDDDEEQEGEDEVPLLEPVCEDSYFKSLVPLADTLNSNTSLWNAKLSYEKDQLVMKTLKPISKNEQIFNIYGELPNSEILRKYGYVELPSSKFEFAQISIADIMAHFIQKYQNSLTEIKEPIIEKLVTTIFELIQNSEYLDMQLEDSEGGIVLPVYEVFRGGELLPEFVLLLLIVDSLLSGLKSDIKWTKKLTRGVEKRLHADLEAFIHRTILKCHQLLEDHSALTKSAYQSIKDIASQRISVYPQHIVNNYQLPEVAKSRKEMADVVLYNEYLCLKDIVDDKFPTVNEDGFAKFKVIEDEKFLKNLLKRKSENEENKTNKRQRK